MINKYKDFFIISGFGMVFLIGLVDYFTGSRTYVLAFYIIPVFQITWFAGKWAGLSISFFSLIMLGVIRFLLDAFPPNPLSVYRQAFIELNIFLIIAYVLSIQIILRNTLKHEKELARTDSLTGMLNIRAFTEILESEIRRACRYKSPISIVYIDLDNFKEVNDRYGHSVGNCVLRSVASIIKDSVRQTDIVARLGGDEFVILFPETKNEPADQIVFKIHSRLNSAMTEQKWPVTSSIGPVSYTQVPDSPDSILRDADQLMYKAKIEGKNRIKQVVMSGNIS
ncbi:MAG: GGDEF domain-containing protein [Nitrospiria bacterium]